MYTLTVIPPANGWVAAVKGRPGKQTGIACGDGDLDKCTQDYFKGRIVPLTATPSPGYEFRDWTGDCSGSSCTLTMNSDKSVSARFVETFKASAGGDKGNYVARYVYVPLPFPARGGSSFYIANVSASATGGLPPYVFKWAEKPTGPDAVYLYRILAAAGKMEEVTVTDARQKADAATATATIKPPSANASQSGGEAAAAFEVPLGGELHFVWGGDGGATARPRDATVVAVDVSSPAIRVSGLSAGETHVIVRPAGGDEELYLPVVVR